MLCKVFDVFGNTLVAQSVDVTPSGIAVKTVSGVVVKYSSTAALSKFDYAQGNVAYLSDLDPRVDCPEPPMDEKGLRLNPTRLSARSRLGRRTTQAGDRSSRRDCWSPRHQC